MAVCYYSLLLTDTNDQLWGYGNNGYNQLGFRDAKVRNIGERGTEMSVNDFFAEQGLRVTYVSPTNTMDCRHMFVKTGDYEIYAFGRNESSQCGWEDLEEDDEFDESGEWQRSVPRLVERFVTEKINIVEIRKGDDHSVFLSDRGRLFGCGSNEFFQLGLDDIERNYGEIVEIPLPSSFVLPVDQIECGGYTTFVVDATRELYGVGFNYYGEFEGIVEREDSVKSITKVNIIGGAKVIQLRCGHGHVCLMDDKARIITFGANYAGQCGVHPEHERTKTDQNGECKPFGFPNKILVRWCTMGVVELPERIPWEFSWSHPMGFPWLAQWDWQIVCGLDSTYILDHKGNLFVFGSNQSGVCLVSDYHRDGHIWKPKRVDRQRILQLTEDRKAVAFVAHHNKLCILTE